MSLIINCKYPTGNSDFKNNSVSNRNSTNRFLSVKSNRKSAVSFSSIPDGNSIEMSFLLGLIVYGGYKFKYELQRVLRFWKKKFQSKK